MIQANELRIGNWILIKGKPRKVEGIDEQGINSSVSGGYYPGETEIEYEARFGGSSFWAGYDEPKPIPLTPEVLEKCGFSKHAEIKTLFFLKEFRVDVKFKNVKLLRQCNAAGESQKEACGFPFLTDRIPCESLHQLQNLYFALTGTELTYNP